MSGKGFDYIPKPDGGDYVISRGSKNASISWETGYGKKTGARTGISFENDNGKDTSMKGNVTYGHRSGLTSDISLDRDISDKTSFKASASFGNKTGHKREFELEHDFNCNASLKGVAGCKNKVKYYSAEYTQDSFGDALSVQALYSKPSGIVARANFVIDGDDRSLLLGSFGNRNAKINYDQIIDENTHFTGSAGYDKRNGANAQFYFEHRF